MHFLVRFLTALPRVMPPRAANAGCSQASTWTRCGALCWARTGSASPNPWASVGPLPISQAGRCFLLGAWYGALLAQQPDPEVLHHAKFVGGSRLPDWRCILGLLVAEFHVWRLNLQQRIPRLDSPPQSYKAVISIPSSKTRFGVLEGRG